MNKFYDFFKNSNPYFKAAVINFVSLPIIKQNFIYQRAYKRRIEKVIREGLRFPYCIEIENTNSCNSSCGVCPRQKMVREGGTMGFETFKKITDQAVINPDVEFRFIGYGEPLMDKGLAEKIRYAKEKKIKATRVITNGHLLDKDTALLLMNSGLDIIGIDLDSDDPQIFNSFRKGLDYSTVVANILGLISLKKEMGRSRPVIRLQVLKIEKNFKDFKGFLRKWNRLVDIIDLVPLNNWAGAIFFAEKTHKRSDFSSPCFKLWNNLPISWNGDVSICCLDFDFKFRIGNINENNLMDIWHNGFREIRQLHLFNKRQSHTLCRECNWESVWWRRRNDLI